MRFHFSLVTVVLCFSLPCWAQPKPLTKTYEGPGPIKFPYPENWNILDAARKQELVNEIKPIINEVAKGKQTNGNLQVMLYEGKDPDSTEINITLNQTPQRIPTRLSDRGRQELTSVLQRLGTALGGQTQIVAITEAKYGEKDGIQSRHDIVIQGERLSQMLVSFPTKDGSVTMTLSARANEFPKYEPMFREILTKLEIPPPPAFDISKLFTSGFGIIVLIVLAKVVMKVVGSLGGNSKSRTNRTENGDSFGDYSGRR